VHACAKNTNNKDQEAHLQRMHKNKDERTDKIH